MTVNARLPLSLFIKMQSVRREDVRGKKTSLTHTRKPNTKNMGRIECSNKKNVSEAFRSIKKGLNDEHVHHRTKEKNVCRRKRGDERSKQVEFFSLSHFRSMIP